MRYVAAYLLASLSGKEPSSEDIEKILSSVGIESDSQKLGLVLKELKGKDVDHLIESGKYYSFNDFLLNIILVLLLLLIFSIIYKVCVCVGMRNLS